MVAGILFAASVLTAELARAPAVTLADNELRLGDVARVTGDGAANVRRVVIARVGMGPSHIQRRQLALLIRRAVPAIVVRGSTDGAVTLTPPPPRNSERECFEAIKPVPADVPIVRSDLAAVPCVADRAASLVHYNLNSGGAVARRPLATGDYLGQIVACADLPVTRGQRLTLVSAAGPVTIRREVTALQPARAGQRRLFVRTSEGQVFAAPVALAVRP